MAAIDPTEAPQADENGIIPSVPRATLKIVRPRFPDMMDELDDERLKRLMYGSSDEDDDEDSEDDDEDNDDDELNGGPSDPAKSKKAKQEAALKKLIEAAKEEEDSDEEMADNGAKTNGTKKPKKKGKEPATSSDDDDDDDDEDDEEIDWQELVVCTLDTERVSIPKQRRLWILTNNLERTSNRLLTLPLPLTRMSILLSRARILST